VEYVHEFRARGSTASQAVPARDLQSGGGRLLTRRVAILTTDRGARQSARTLTVTKKSWLAIRHWG
jgi:hypothetical protein